MNHAPPPPWPPQPGHPHAPPGPPGQPHPGSFGGPAPEAYGAPPSFGHPGHPQPGHPGQPHPGGFGPGQAAPGPFGHPGQPHPGPFGHPGQPHSGQFGHPGQPQPGQFGHPGQPFGHPGHPGPFGPGQAGPFGAPPSYGPPPGPYGQPYHAWAGMPQYPAPKPASSGGHLKIIGGIGLVLIMGTALLRNAHEGFDSSEGLVTTALFSGFLGASLLLLLSGIFTAAKKAPNKAVMLAVPVGAALLCIGLGPFISTAYCEIDEQRRWDELTAAMDHDPVFYSGRWHLDYETEVHPKFQREQWRSRYMLARVKENIAAKDAAGLRAILQEIADSGHASLYGQAEQAASEAFTGYYEAAKVKMYAPAADGVTREFPVDEQLRAAFAQVLEHLAHAPQATVYVAFTNGVDLTPPEGTDELLALYRSDPQAMEAFPAGAPVIEPQQSFSAAYDSRRRQTFMTAMTESFGQVFDANLLTLVPLPEGESREGKIVIEVSSHIVRLPKFFFWEKETSPGMMRVAGLLFGIAVDWELEIYGPDGTTLYAQPALRSEPAGNVSVSTQPGDPDWGMYSVLMDSAYYNYSRHVTGMFGLVPPDERTVFVYQGM